MMPWSFAGAPTLLRERESRKELESRGQDAGKEERVNCRSCLGVAEQQGKK